MSRAPSSSFSHSFLPYPDLHSFPTRRSSDLRRQAERRLAALGLEVVLHLEVEPRDAAGEIDVLQGGERPDRKSTRLNSSHLGISYAVFCLKKKKKHTHEGGETTCRDVNTVRR